MNAKMKIDAEKFAFNFMESLPHRANQDDIEALAKESLSAYLSAYYLVQNFNAMEKTFFEDSKPKNISEYQKLLSELNIY